MSRLIAYAFLAFISSKGLLATYLTLGALGEASSCDLRLRLAMMLWEKMSAKPRELAGRTGKEKNKISRRNLCSAENAVLLSKGKKPAEFETLFHDC